MSRELAAVQRITDHAQLVADMGRRIVAELSAAEALDVAVRDKRVADFTAKLHARAQRLCDMLAAVPSAPRSRKHTKQSARTWPRASVPSTPPAPVGELRTWE